MLPKKNRLNLSAGKASKSQSKIFSANFRLIYIKDVQEQQAAVVVSKKVAKKAVDRNRIRRITTEALKKIGLPKENLKILVVNNIAKLKTDEITPELKKLLSNIK